MSDVSPNYRIEQQRLAHMILEQKTAIARTKLEVMEFSDRMAKNNENIGATQKSLIEVQKELDTAVKALDKQRKKSQIAALNANVERQTLENLELEERALQMLDRGKTEFAALQQFLSQLASLDQAHGPNPDESLDVIVQRCKIEQKEGTAK